MFLLVLKVVIGITCFSITVWQCIQLVDNFSTRETLRKRNDKFVDEDTITPTVIICSDPPQEDNDNDIKTQSDNWYIYGKDWQPQKMKTMFKVIKVREVWKKSTLFIFFLKASLSSLVLSLIFYYHYLG